MGKEGLLHLKKPVTLSYRFIPIIFIYLVNIWDDSWRIAY